MGAAADRGTVDVEGVGPVVPGQREAVGVAVCQQSGRDRRDGGAAAVVDLDVAAIQQRHQEGVRALGVGVGNQLVVAQEARHQHLDGETHLLGGAGEAAIVGDGQILVRDPLVEVDRVRLGEGRNRAGAAMEGIVACTTVERVVAGAAVERVVVGCGVDEWRRVHHDCPTLDGEVGVQEGHRHADACGRAAMDIQLGDVQEVRVLVDAHGTCAHHSGQHDGDGAAARGPRDRGGGEEHATLAVEHRDCRAVEAAAPRRPVDDLDIGDVERLVEVELQPLVAGVPGVVERARVVIEHQFHAARRVVA